MTRLVYERLRVRLRRVPRPLERDEQWGKKLSRTRWTYFEPHEFRAGTRSPALIIESRIWKRVWWAMQDLNLRPSVCKVASAHASF